MSYVYEAEKPKLLTDLGSRQFVIRRDAVLKLARTCGVIKASHAMSVMGGGDSWSFLATLDRMVELGDLVSTENPLSRAGQDQIFIVVEG